MCGIAGVLDFNRSVSFDRIKRMTDVLVHRGPDGEGQWMNAQGNVALGHRRLSIIDLTADAGQPMHFDSGRYTITFNGEIYNYIELRNSLVKQGVSFKSQSDTEVLLALYALKKEACLQDLDGMFAFAIWDELEQTLFCARDRFGEKPFYYAGVDEKAFVFASEMKALWADGIPKERNDRMLLNFMNKRTTVSDFQHPSETFYKKIQKLEPAHYLIVNKDGRIRKSRYWDIDQKKVRNGISEQEAIEEFRELFLRSVSLRLRSDVPVGSSLSGGLDSSTIVSAIPLLNKEGKVSQKTFSARFREFAKDEGFFMEKAIEGLPVESFFVWPDEQALSDEIRKLCYYQEEPFGGGSTFAQWKVMELARQSGVKVLLDGQGADEVLAGYGYYFPTYLHELFRSGSSSYETELAAYRELQNPGFKGFGKEGVLASDQLLGWRQGLKNTLRPVYLGLFRRKAHASILQDDHILTREFRAQFRNQDIISSDFDGGLNEQLYKTTCVEGLQDLLRYAERCCMAHSIEVRMPFLSHPLVEYLFQLPPSLKIHQGWSKYILRKAFQDVVPQEITWRKDKIAYEAPQTQWMKFQPVKDIVQDAIQRLENEHIICPASSRKLTEQDEWNCLVVANTLLT